MKTTLILMLQFALISAVSAQQLTQTVRGTITDFDTKTPIIGARIIIVDSEPLLGAMSDLDGNFKITGVAVGRPAISITATGYQPVFLPGFLVESGKEAVLQIEMLEDIKTLNAVEVTAEGEKSQPINKMVTVSAKTFSVDETNRYAGSLNDPARMVSGFAGVTGNAEGDNDIVVRGNSPKGILWRVEGIDVPNPNHFANEGGTGGPISALNGSMLANSDFFSGAFAPEYGNAYSGVFDVRFRQGNNEKREYSFSIGVMGTDVTLEGPFKPGYSGSYLVNYRYSTIALLDKAGILDFNGIPKYQDASFKIMLPTKKAGTFSVVGLGGISHIFQTDQDEVKEIIYGTYDFNANLGVLGIKHTYLISDKTHVRSFVAVTTASNGGQAQWLKADSSGLFISERQLFTDNRYKFATTLNHKFNSKNTLQFGGIYTVLDYNLYLEENYSNSGNFYRQVDGTGTSAMLQGFLSWKYRLHNDLTMVSGMHYTHFMLNNRYALEPRLGIKWQITPSQNVSFGAGLHSRVESLSTYLYSEQLPGGESYLPNKNLDLTKSAHFVIGYGLQLNENLHFKTELYYQHLYDVPVENNTASSLSLINWSNWFPSVHLVNEGRGRNYGVEMTLERFFEKNYYFLLTGSAYQSSYTAMDGIERDSRYDAGYASNFLFGKEFKFGETKNNTIGINTKISLIGGNRYTPIDLAASQSAGYGIRSDIPYSAKGDNIFFVNFGVTYRLDKPRASHAIKIDIQNLTNNQARVDDYYNPRTGQIEYSRQLPFIPNIIYTIKF
jgi:hypothetical protein